MLFQVRVADALLPLAMLFGWPAIIGLSLGTIVANSFGGLGPVDIFGGTVANFVACTLAYEFVRRVRFRWRFFVGSWIINLCVTFIVGSYLAFILGFPVMLGWFGVFLGSCIAINVLGYLVLHAIKRRFLQYTM